MDENKDEYVRAYEAWTSDVGELHSVLIEGKRLEPPKLKALLNREARSKERYDEARRRLLGISE
jgi:hypothetical protein